MKTHPTTAIHGLYKITQARAIDGDTIVAVTLIPFGQMANIRFRLKGWWAPEMNGPSAANGKLAQLKLQTFLDEHALYVYSRTDRQDKYGRYLVELHTGHRVVTPGEVLGIFALTAEQHKAEIDELRKKHKAALLYPQEDAGEHVG